jgi:ankyrin repeat protein
MKAWWDPYAAETVLCAACRRGEAVIVEQILRHINELPSSRATQLANATDGLLRSPLHLACIAGSQEVIELLLASPYTDLNKLDMKNRSALSYLLEGNPMDNFLSVELLLEQPKLVLTAEEHVYNGRCNDGVMLTFDRCIT